MVSRRSTKRCRLRDKLPVGPRWQYELKFDGYRIQAHLDGDSVRLFTKNGFDRTDSLPAIAAALRELPVQSAILDGEAVILDDESVSNFFALHPRWHAAGRPTRC